MNRFCIFSALCTLLCFTFGLNTVCAEESKVDMTKYITLTVKQGEKIKLDFAASTTGVWVKVSGVKDEKEEEAPTQLHAWYNSPKHEYEAMGTEITVYGVIDQFHISHNKENLTAIDISQNLNLTKLFCSHNQISSLDVSQNIKLKELRCFDNQLSSLDIRRNVNLTELSCGYNQLSILDVSQNVNLTTLDCSWNSLSSLDVTKNVNLTRLDCRNNPLSNLDVSQNVNLTELICAFNRLSSLNVTKNVNLTTLDCGWNSLSSLDVTKNVNLKWLFCEVNQLSSLDVSKNTKLKLLSIHGNNFSTSVLNNIYCQLPNRTGKERGTLRAINKRTNVEDEPLVMSSSTTITNAKNWAIQYDESYTYFESITGNYTCGSTYGLTLEPATIPNSFWYQGDEWKTTVNSTGNWKLDETTPLPDWLSVEPKQGSNGTQVKVTAKPNAEEELRRAALTFVLTDDANTKQVVLLTQTNPSISVAPWSYTFPPIGETKTLSVESSAAWTVNSSSAEWLTIEPKSGAAGTATVTVKADANNNQEERSTELTFALKDNTDIKRIVKLKQKGAFISVVPAVGYTFPYAGETKNFTVESSGAWSVTSSNAEWFPIEKKEGEAGSTKVTIKADANNKKEERSTELTFALKDHPDIKQVVTLKQKGASISVTPSQEYTFPYAGETKTYTVESSGAWTVTASNAEWLTIEPKTGEAGTTTVTVKAEANNKKEERSTELTFALKDNAEVKQVVTVKQAVNPNAVEDVLFAGISVAPNPFSSQLRIRNEEAVNARYELVNSNGVAVRTGVLQGVETVLNTEKLPAGAYLLRILSGSESKTLRVVKE